MGDPGISQLEYDERFQEKSPELSKAQTPNHPGDSQETETGLGSNPTEA